MQEEFTLDLSEANKNIFVLHKRKCPLMRSNYRTLLLGNFEKVDDAINVAQSKVGPIETCLSCIETSNSGI